MVTGIRIYFEGDRRLKPGFHEFFGKIRDAARRCGLDFNLIGSDAEAVRNFGIALRCHPRAFNVLLVDSDGSIGDALAQLKRRSDWQRWRGAEVGDDHIHWMVQIMESWFLADRDALRRYYGSRLNEAALPGDPRHVEEIPKRDVLDGLKRSTGGRYHKTLHAPKILARLKPEVVCSAAPSCQRLFETLLARLASQRLSGTHE